MLLRIYLSLPQLRRVPLSHASGGVAQLFYAQAVTLVHFFWNSTVVGAFSTSAVICDGQPIDRALSFATSGSVRSLQTLRRPGSSSSCSFLDTPYETGRPDPRVEILGKQ